MINTTGSHANQIEKTGAGSTAEGDAVAAQKNGTATTWFVPPVVIPAALVALVIVMIAAQVFS